MFPFTRKPKPPHPFLEPVTTSPYMAARQERSDRQLMILAAGKLWRAVACLALVGNIVLGGALGWVTQMRKETPFVLVVDKWGYTVPVGRAAPASVESYVQFHLKEFIRFSRSISVDTYALENNIKHAYTFVKKPSAAFNYLMTYYTEVQKPFERAKEISVFPEDISLIRVSEFTFRARWSELTRANSGIPQQIRSDVPA